LQAPETLALPWLPQAEAITFADGGRSLFVASEQLPSPLLQYRLVP
jgi:hypothetical protein